LKTKASILFEVGKKLDIPEVGLEPPRMGEVMIKKAAAGVGGRFTFGPSSGRGLNRPYLNGIVTPTVNP
jgi:hypothetical protein